MEKYESIQQSEQQQQRNRARTFTALVLMAQVFGLLSVILVAVWMGHFSGGFSWSEQKFNYHPLFMTIGMVFLYGEALLVYRVFHNSKKIYIKILHGCLHLLALIFAIVGLNAVFSKHIAAGETNLYSFHSWMGIITVSFFAMQWVCGLVSFLLPAFPTNLRVWYKPIHVFWGVALMVMAIGTVLLGLNENMMFKGEAYEKRTPEAYVANFFGLAVIAYGITVGYIVATSNLRSSSSTDEEHLQLTQ